MSTAICGVCGAEVCGTAVCDMGVCPLRSVTLSPIERRYMVAFCSSDLCEAIRQAEAKLRAGEPEAFVLLRVAAPAEAP